MTDVLPELAPVLQLAAAMPPFDYDDIEGLRAQGTTEGLLGLYVPEVESVTTTSVELAVDGGTIELRVSRPDGADGAPVLLYLHGGGWILGSALTTDRLCRRLAARSGNVVVSVDYRLAPEHPYPTPLEDAYAAVVWASELGDDVAIGGQSAGGNIAAGLALLARDRGGPRITAQWLDVPALDLRLPDDEALRSYGAGYGLDIANVAPTIGFYAGGTDLATPYISPLAAEDLTGLPPAVITVAGCDPLRDQGLRYAAALEAAGVAVRATTWPGHLHATMSLTTLAPSCAEYEDEVVDALATLRTK